MKTTLTGLTLALALVLAGARTPSAHADTHVSTSITTNTEWTVAGSPYIVDQSITISTGVTLTVDAGVTVRFALGKSLTVNGTLKTNGTSSDEILFTSINDVAGGTPAAGDWGTITLPTGTGHGLQATHTTFRYGHGLSVNTTAAVAELSYVTISNMGGSGLYVGGVNQTPGAVVSHSEIRNNTDNGIKVDNSAAFVTVTFSSIHDNTNYGLLFNLLKTTSPDSRVDNNDIYNNGKSGVNFYFDPLNGSWRWPHGNYNNIYGNNAGGIAQLTSLRRVPADVDWKYNYWGPDAYWFINPSKCRDAGMPGFLTDDRSPRSLGTPTSGPIPVQSVACPNSCCQLGGVTYPSIAVNGFAIAPVTHSKYPVVQTCGDGTHAVDASPCAGDPVDTLTGSFTDARIDLALPGIGVPFRFRRSYASNETDIGRLGAGWRDGYSASLVVAQNGDVTLHAEDGMQVQYTKQADGSFKPAYPGVRSKLVGNADGSYDLTRHDQVVYHFDSSGTLLSMKDRNGKGLTFGYSGSDLTSITNASGRVITLTYSGGLLQSIALPDGRTVSYGYTGGLLTSVTDARGHTWTYGYDGSGRLASLLDPLGHYPYRVTYDSGGRVVDVQDALGNHTTFGWNDVTETATVTDARGNQWKDVYSGNVLVKRIDPLGNTTAFTRDNDMNLVAVRDPKNNVTTMTYDGSGNMLSRTAPAPLSYSETWAYNARNDVTSYKNGRGNTTSFGYDAAGNLTSTTAPGSVLTQYGRDARGLLTSITDPRSKTTTFTRDADGNVTAITTPLGEQTTLGYNAGDRLTSVVDPRGNVAGADPADFTTSYAYDAADDLTSATDPLGHATSWSYDAAGNPSSRTDANGHTTSWDYNAADDLTAVTAPGGAVTSYAYDAAGNLNGRTDADNHATTYVYDAANELTSLITAASQKWTYTYDANGNVTKMVDANGNTQGAPAGSGTTTYGYDALDRLTSIAYSDTTPAVSYAYDANDNRTSMGDGGGTQSYTYDALDRPTAVTRGSDTFSYGYDPAGDLTQETYPGGRAMTYAYDDDSRLASVSSNGATTSYSYDAAGNLKRTDLPSGNGYSEIRTYDRAGRLTSLQNTNGASTLSSFDYAYDPVGNPTQVTTVDGVVTYGYDARDRLTDVCFQSSCPGSSDPFIRYAYDAVGNRTSEDRPAGTTSYSYNGADELTQTSGPGGTVGYGYDANGNETQAGSRTFAWDLANRLKSTTSAGTTTTYSYNGDGDRLQTADGSSTTNYLWDANGPLPELALERDGSNAVLRSYLRGADLVSMDSGGQTSYFHRDGLGSISNVTSTSGAPQWTYTYEPSGSARTSVQNDPSAPANPIRFTGELNDAATGLYDLRAREYDPATGRFLSTDPLGPDPNDPSISPYVYANQRPTLYTDPSGLRGGIWTMIKESITGGVTDTAGCLWSVSPFVRHIDVWKCANAAIIIASFYEGGGGGGVLAAEDDALLLTERAARREAFRRYRVPTSQANNYERVPAYGKNPNLKGPDDEPWEVVHTKDVNGNPVKIKNHKWGHTFHDVEPPVREGAHYDAPGGNIFYGW